MDSCLMNSCLMDSCLIDSCYGLFWLIVKSTTPHKINKFEHFKQTERQSAIRIAEMTLVFPEDAEIVAVGSPRTPSTLRFVNSLSNWTLKSVSLIYLVLVFVVQPLLELQYARRRELSAFALMRLRELFRKMVPLVSKPISCVAVKRGSKYYSDSIVQTAGEGSETPGGPDSASGGVLLGLETVRDRLQALNGIEHPDTYPVSFQLKKLNNKVDSFHNLSLSELVTQVRTLKGWFLSRGV